MNFMTYGGWSFSYPAPLLDSSPPQLSGIYAIQVINLAWKPLPYEPIYFGESDDLSRVGSTSVQSGFAVHPELERWSAHPAVRDGGNLYVSYLWLHRGAELRKHLVRTLVARYRPTCNTCTSPLGEAIEELLGGQAA